MDRPPLGLLPKDIHMTKRFQDICEAIVRYWHTNWPIPVEWVEEYNELIEKGYATETKKNVFNKYLRKEEK